MQCYLFVSKHHLYHSQMQAEHSRGYVVKTNRAFKRTEVEIWLGVCAKLSETAGEEHFSQSSPEYMLQGGFKNKQQKNCMLLCSCRGKHANVLTRAMNIQLAVALQAWVSRTGLGAFTEDLTVQGLETKDDFIWDNMEKYLPSYTGFIANASFPSFSPRFPGFCCLLNYEFLIIYHNILNICPLHSMLISNSSKHLSHHYLCQLFLPLLIVVLRI